MHTVLGLEQMTITKLLLMEALSFPEFNTLLHNAVQAISHMKKEIFGCRAMEELCT